MLTLNDGRTELWQWDTGRTLSVDADCSQVHFSNKVFGRSIDVDVADGVAIIPDILLQTDKDLSVWAFVGTAENGYTKISKIFKVNRRNKPSDYVFTPPEQTTLAELVDRLDKIEESQDPDAIKNAVEDYLEQNPVDAPVDSVNGKTGAVQLTAADVGAIAYETDPTVPEWAKQPQKPTYTADEVGAVSQADLQEATNEALAQAKASGEFDGADGQPGENGADGAPGKDGATGADGKDGITPTIGENGNWYLGDTDTGKPSRGETGQRGETGATGAQGPAGADGKSAYAYAVEGGYTGTEEEFAAKLAQEMPDTLPNPNALTFTGAVTGTYDGSEPMTVNIPSGGSGSGAEKTWSLLLDETLSEDTAYIFQDLSAPVTELIIEFIAGGDGTHRDVTIFNRQGAGYGNNIATFKNVLRSDATVAARFVIHCVAFPDLAFFRCQYNNYNDAVGDNIINNSSKLLFNDEPGAFKGSTNFDCISIGCWSGGNSGVFKAGTMVKVYGKI